MKHSLSVILNYRFALTVVGLVAAIWTTSALGQTRATNANVAQAAAKVDVNSADLKSLETLPGVGPAIAQKIIDGRPYRTSSDLEKVSGLSKAKVAALKDRVTFGRTAATPAAAARAAKPRSSSSELTPTGRRNDATEPNRNTSATSDRLAPGEKLNINTASAAELDALSGIGPVKAQAIVDYRKQNGDFKSIEEIEKVKGIKSGEFSKIKDHIKVSN